MTDTMQPQSSTGEEISVDSFKEKLEKCEAERIEYLDGWKRAKADFVNYKNEEMRRLEELKNYLTGSMIHDILPVLDSFDLASESLKAESEHEDHGRHEEHGLLLIRLQMLDILKKMGLEPIIVKPGDAFNPQRHEALAEFESDIPAGAIHDEVQKGYMLNGRVIRPARVRLAKKSDQN